MRDHFSDIDGILNRSRAASPSAPRISLAAAIGTTAPIHRPAVLCCLDLSSAPMIIGIQLPKQSNKLGGQRF
jgi:hypothetical protein